MNISDQVDIISIFTDAATSPPMSLAVGAFLYVPFQSFDKFSEFTPEILFTTIADNVIYKKYESKKSTWSEIKTVIDALYLLHENSKFGQKVEIYTDCQTLYDLFNGRKEKLQQNNFMTKAGKIHPNADLYKELFSIAEQFKITLFKIKGHASTAHRITIKEKIFAILDKLSRKKLRSILK
jgi:ribonuclease HI